MAAEFDDYALALDQLRMLAQQDLADWWANTDGLKPHVRMDTLREAFHAVQSTYGEQAAYLAADHLFLQRSLDESLAGLEFPAVAEPADYEQARAGFNWATAKYRESFDPALLSVAKDKLSGVLNRLVAQPAHDTVAKAVETAGTGYARVPEPGACSFCLMLASRGAVYSKESVQSANGYHDNCRCVGVEVKSDADLPRINRELHELWQSSRVDNHRDFELALKTRKEFGTAGDARNTKVYKLPDDSHRAAIERWQGMDRFYAKVQKAVEGKSSDSETLLVAAELRRAAVKTPLESDVLMWRGVRNWHTAFGVESLEELALYDEEQARFIAISSDRRISEEQFTTFGKAGALLKIRAKKGTPGIWMPSNGSTDEDLVAQQEFLVPPGARMRVVNVSRGKLPIIEVEMSYE